jgi:hypothetical protein
VLATLHSIFIAKDVPANTNKKEEKKKKKEKRPCHLSFAWLKKPMLYNILFPSFKKVVN